MPAARGFLRLAFVAMSAAVIASGCARSTEPAPKRTLYGSVRLVGYDVAENGVVKATHVVDDADSVAVELLRGTTVIARALTAKGFYQFTGLAPGSYAARVRIADDFVVRSADLVIAEADLAVPRLVVASRGDLLPSPNPLLAYGTVVWFDLSDTEQIRVQVVRPDGTPVRTLLEGTLLPGLKSASWGAVDAAGHLVTGKLYWVLLESPSEPTRAHLLFR